MILIGDVSNMMNTFYCQPVVPAVLVSSRIVSHVSVWPTYCFAMLCRPVPVLCLSVVYTCLTKMLVGCCYFFYSYLFISFFLLFIFFTRKVFSISDSTQHNAVSLILWYKEFGLIMEASDSARVSNSERYFRVIKNDAEIRTLNNTMYKEIR